MYFLVRLLWRSGLHIVPDLVCRSNTHLQMRATRKRAALRCQSCALHGACAVFFMDLTANLCGVPACQATFYALRATYGYLSPELWTATRYTKSPLQEFTDFLAKPTVGDMPRAPPVTTY